MATLLRSLRRSSDASPPSPASARNASDLAIALDKGNPPKRWGSLPNLLTPKRKAKRDKQQSRTDMLVEICARSEVNDQGEGDAAPLGQQPQQAQATPPHLCERTQSPSSSSRARPASLAHRARGSMKSAILGVRAALTLAKYAKHKDVDEAIGAEEQAATEPPPRITMALESDHAEGEADVSLADACLLVPTQIAEEQNQPQALPYPGYYGTMRRSDSALATSTTAYTATTSSAAHHLIPLVDETGDDVTPLTSPRHIPRAFLPRSTSHPAQLAPPRSRSATGAPLAFAVAASRAASRVHSRVPSGAPLLPASDDSAAVAPAVAHAAAWAQMHAPLFVDAGVNRAAAAGSRVASPKLHEQPLDWDWRAAAAAMPELASSPPTEGKHGKAAEAEGSPVRREGSQRTLSAAGTMLPTYAPLSSPMPPAYQPDAGDAHEGNQEPQRDADA